jgi:hypothetical protein
MITLAGHQRRAGRAATAALVAEIEASELHILLAGQGFALQPLRIPAGLTRGDLRLRLTWKKTDGAEVRTVRLTHVVTVPDRA